MKNLDLPLGADLLDEPFETLLAAARRRRDAAHPRLQTYSPKVFIPLTQLCRNLCHYCTFSQPPKAGQAAYLTREEVLAIAREGKAAGCTEALFTLGDKPELRFKAARDELERLGHASTISYLVEMCAAVSQEVGLLPHVNAGVMNREEMLALRGVSVSQGLMLETVSERLCAKGGAHYRSPDKHPAARIETIRMAGELQVPFTSGILIGIGETRAERIEALETLRDLHLAYGHIQEVIVQNFRAKPKTVMAHAPEPDMEDLLWTIAAARMIMPPNVSIQAPPNLSAADFPRLILAGINDWGGVSPVTPDHVNPEAPWPEIERLAAATAAHERILVPRLPAYPAWGLLGLDRWQAPKMAALVRASADASGWGRADCWSPGMTVDPHRTVPRLKIVSPAIEKIIGRAIAREALSEREVVSLLETRDIDMDYVCRSADLLRRETCGDTVAFVVNRNINYTNICNYKCGFCAFSKGDKSEALRGKAYDLDLNEVVRRAREAWERGATEVCLQGGIHPHYTGDTYLSLARSVRDAVPGIHIHAFSPLEVTQGAATLGLSIDAYLKMLKEAGLNTLPGTAAEILDDEVRAVICPDKLSTREWLDVAEASHRAGFRTTATIMFGHVETLEHQARHLIAIRDLQSRTGGFTEFVPLPFVHMEAPMALKGLARRGPTFREVLLMHAVARLVLHGRIANIQTSWVKLGRVGVAACLAAGANDIGGTLMNESISRAAGTRHGQELAPREMKALIASAGRKARQRDTLYGEVSDAVQQRGEDAAALEPIVLTAPVKRKVNTMMQLERL
ncbi:5-amino-6-(D-ribitylamino)uracil--L-tyrosine 4-hydroxyphenyl transferase CofH [Sphingobium sp. CR2-8]|uniref:5-amino-6-(D-ribitylamino)uracil--L-tyrosine 4-hydroxyphenyl transferase CofH n=1 Tax=Sphingobium sp. CR2-8 TaxID=1306534 RepID=UPI002DBC4E98|nr:5-amino-6-(D-ribitylamino)uracil--L-tyrosine 4-hydroxyphenyl transferase CofH [Sphingobium sp. CR2-8]MEC3909515.1 5-amino-6-(D-ribitylamino)uracil--L-tyrosine 4-hydroxyphenyl transferase CofH [Sphingobium sp. CR2-8]